MLEAHGEFGASAEYPEIAQQDSEAGEEPQFLDYDSEDIVGERQRQTSVLTGPAYADALDASVGLRDIAELFLLTVD